MFVYQERTTKSVFYLRFDLSLLLFSSSFTNTECPVNPSLHTRAVGLYPLEGNAEFGGDREKL